MAKNSSGSSAKSAAPQKPVAPETKAMPAAKKKGPAIDKLAVGRTIIVSKVGKRAMDARTQLKKLDKAGLHGLSDQKASQMAMALGLKLRGTGASGNVTRGDYMTALEARLPIAAAPKRKAGA